MRRIGFCVSLPRVRPALIMCALTTSAASAGEGMGGRVAAYKVLYLNHAPEEVYAIIRAQAPPGFELLTLRNDDDLERREKLLEADFVIVATVPITDGLLAGAPKLKLIQHQGVGYDTTDVQAARKRGVVVGLTPEGTTIGVAEHTLLLILAVYKKLTLAHNSLREGRWLQFALRPGSYELCGKTLGLIGFGRIGREVAKRARAFDARVLFYERWARVTLDQKAEWGVEEAGFRQLLAESDIVSLHLPLTRRTRGIIGRKALRLMKPGAVLINTARGRLVDEGALIEALRAGRIGAAGLDVFQNEPPQPDNALLTLENVIITPHIAAGTRDALVAKMKAAFANIERVARGEPPRHQAL